MGVLRFMINYPALGVIFKLLVKLKPSMQRCIKSQALTERKLKSCLELDVDRQNFLAYARPPVSSNLPCPFSLSCLYLSILSLPFLHPYISTLTIS